LTTGTIKNPTGTCHRLQVIECSPSVKIEIANKGRIRIYIERGGQKRRGVRYKKLLGAVKFLKGEETLTVKDN